MRLLSMVDVLAALRTPVEADVLLVEFDDGRSVALAIRQLIHERNAWLVVDDHAHFRSADPALELGSDLVVSVRAMPFEEFVGVG